MKYTLILALLCLRAFGFETGLEIPRDWRSFAPFHTVKHHGELPKHFDLRDRGLVTPVKDQGQCGSCWAFGSTAILESAIKKETGKMVSLSEQELVSCDGSSYGCSGGYFAHDYQKSPGQSYTSELPYQAADTQCPRNLSHAEKVFSWAYIGDPNGSPTVDEIKAALVTDHAVAVTVAADSYWQNYRGGFLSHCTDGQTNHIVALVGWDEKGWIVKNSWGENWGEKGFMHIKYGCDRIGEQATYVEYKVAQ